MDTVKSFFNISTGVEFLDVPLIGDIPLYLDPYMIANSSSDLFDGQTAKKKIDDFFITAFNFYQNGNKSKALKMFNNSNEMNYTHLGLSKGKAEGRGLSETMLDDIFSLMVSSDAFGNDEFGNPRILPIFIPDFGPDRFSDLIASIIVNELVDFTIKCSKKYDMKLTREKIHIRNFWNNETKTWEEVHAPVLLNPNNEPIILVPKTSVLDSLQFSAEDYVNDVVLPYKQVYHFENNTEGLIRTKEIKNIMVPVKPTKNMIKTLEIKNRYSKNKTKSYALEETLNAPWLLKQYLVRHDRKRIDPLTDWELEQFLK